MTLIFVAITLTLFFIPLLPSLAEWRSKSDARPITIRNEYDTDITYFAQGFRQFVTKNFSAMLAAPQFAEGNIGPQDYYQITGDKDEPVFNERETRKKATGRLIVAAHELNLPEGIFYEREVYSAGNLTSGNGNYFRAVLAEGNIKLGSHNHVLRWIHSEGDIAAGKGAEFYGRISAKGIIRLMPECYFERMRAAEIRFGETAAAELPAREKGVNVPPEEFAKVINSDAGRRLIDGDAVTPRNWFFAGNLVVKGRLTISSGSHIKGSIKSYRNLTIEENCAIEGSAVSSAMLHIDRKCLVTGPVIAEAAIYINNGAIVGRKELPTSISAPRIFIADGVLVYGTIWAGESALFTRNLEIPA